MLSMHAIGNSAHGPIAEKPSVYHPFRANDSSQFPKYTRVLAKNDHNAHGKTY